MVKVSCTDFERMVGRKVLKVGGLDFMCLYIYKLVKDFGCFVASQVTKEITCAKTNSWLVAPRCFSFGRVMDEE